MSNPVSNILLTDLIDSCLKSSKTLLYSQIVRKLNSAYSKDSNSRLYIQTSDQVYCIDLAKYHAETNLDTFTTLLIPDISIDNIKRVTIGEHEEILSYDITVSSFLLKQSYIRKATGLDLLDLV